MSLALLDICPTTPPNAFYVVIILPKKVKFFFHRDSETTKIEFLCTYLWMYKFRFQIVKF